MWRGPQAQGWDFLLAGPGTHPGAKLVSLGPLNRILFHGDPEQGAGTAAVLSHLWLGAGGLAVWTRPAAIPGSQLQFRDSHGGLGSHARDARATLGKKLSASHVSTAHQQLLAGVIQREEEHAGLWMTRWLSQEVGYCLALTPALAQQ